ncbi:hypothetical protein BMS3Bbin11_00575 [bacterium BMS3Bbin11]|nr:hypothetical protein BMS3Bbin11_00575 [bacterium BMS3Bbin11]
MALFKSRFMYIKLIGVYRTLHYIFTQSVSSGNKHHITKTGFGIKGKHDTTGSKVRTHHLHNTNRQRDFEMLEALIDTVMNRTISKQAGKTTAADIQQLLFTFNIKVGVLLPGKAGIRQIFRGGRATHSNADITRVLFF